MQEKTINSTQIFKNSFLDLREDKVLLPNNKTSSRVYIKHPGAACVLPITKDNKLILVQQFRYPIKEVVIEIPAGKKDDNESGYECIKREIEEETGYQSDNFIYINSFHNCLGYSDELIDFFIAKDCYKVENPIESDDDEFIEPLIVTIDEAKDLLTSKKVTDVKTILALQYFFLEVHNG